MACCGPYCLLKVLREKWWACGEHRSRIEIFPKFIQRQSRSQSNVNEHPSNCDLGCCWACQHSVGCLNYNSIFVKPSNTRSRTNESRAEWVPKKRQNYQLETKGTQNGAKAIKNESRSSKMDPNGSQRARTRRKMKRIIRPFVKTVSPYNIEGWAQHPCVAHVATLCSRGIVIFQLGILAQRHFAS